MFNLLVLLTTPKPTPLGEVDFSDVTTPIVGLINAVMGPAIAIVGAVGAIYCIGLGIKFAKAEEQQDREKAKGALKNAIIGFLLIFVLLVALNIAIPIMTQWAGIQQ